MTVQDLITLLTKPHIDPDALVWISDQQGGGGLANGPYRLSDKFYEFLSGDTAKCGDIIISYENT